MTSFIEKLRIPISEIFLGQNFLVYLFEEPQIAHSKIIRACIADFLEGRLSCKKPATVYWSKSDTRNYVAIAVAAMPIGIDIEYMRKRPFEQISRRFFHPSEITSDREKFYEIWTSKEAAVKRDKLTIATNLAKCPEGTIITLEDLPPDIKGAAAL
jgi:phosphopantetheinyl transferase